MNYRKKCIDLLQQNGYVFKRHGGNHDIFFNPDSRQMISVKRHNFDKDTFRYILKEAHIDWREG